MNQEIKTKWLAALRSGKFKQTKGALRRPVKNSSDHPGGYCCLGVLCKIVEPETRWRLDGSASAYRFNADRAMPSDKIEISLDLTVCQKDAYYKLSHMNDSLDYTFSEIADFIEANL